MTSRLGRLGVVAVLSLIGLIVTVYLSGLYYDLQVGAAGFRSSCSLSENMNCDAIAASRWAELIPGFPLSSWAAGWYLAIALFALIARDSEVRKDALRFLWPLSAIAAVASLFYLGIMAFVMKTFCLYCLVGHTIDFINLALIYSIMKAEKVSLSLLPWVNDGVPMARLRAYGMTLAICVLGGLFTLKIVYLTDSQQARDMDRAIAEVMMTAPVEVKVDPNSPAHGPAASAPVTLVEFSDFQCPHCKHGALILKTVRARYGSQVRMVLRSFPLDASCNRMIKGAGGGHSQACEAARAAICGYQMGIYDQVYEGIFENQADLESKGVLGVLKLTPEQTDSIKSCMNSPQTRALQAQDIEEGIRLGVEATPTYFINGRKVPFQLDAPSWGRVIDQLMTTP